MEHRKELLISLIIMALTTGSFVGTALAHSQCTCSSPDYACGDSSTNCCGCADYHSTCTTCDEDEDCDTSETVIYPEGTWRNAKCVEKGC